MFDSLCILAADNGAGGPSRSFDPTFLIGMMLMLFVFLWVMNAPRRKEEKRRREMLSKLKRNDRVLTRGGVLGTVVGIKDNEVTIKVDESNNTKVTLLRAYIDQVLADEAKEKSEKT